MGITRVLFRVGLLLILVIILAGCMEALKTDGLDDPNRSVWPGVKVSPTPLARGTNTLASPPPPSPSPIPVWEQPEEPSISPIPTMTPIPPASTAIATVMAIPPTETATTVLLPVSTPKVVITLPTAPMLSPQELWRSQQYDRVVFDTLKSYRTTGSTLWWYDPINQYHVGLGSFSGNFVAQAQFRLNLNGQIVDALEVPYQVNQSYGLQALSPVLLDRIRAAGYGEWIDTYVVLTAEVHL